MNEEEEREREKISLSTLLRRRRFKRRLPPPPLSSIDFNLPPFSLPRSLLLAMSDSDFSEDEYVPKAKVRESSYEETGGTEEEKNGRES